MRNAYAYDFICAYCVLMYGVQRHIKCSFMPSQACAFADHCNFVFANTGTNNPSCQLAGLLRRLPSQACMHPPPQASP